VLILNLPQRGAILPQGNLGLNTPLAMIVALNVMHVVAAA
jgi:hypothetical protein